MTGLRAGGHRCKYCQARVNLIDNGCCNECANHIDHAAILSATQAGRDTLKELIEEDQEEG